MPLSRRQFLSTALAFAATPAFAQKSQDRLVAAFPRAVRTLDGNYADLRENDILGLLVDDALFAVSPTSGEPVPLAAKSHRFIDPTTLRIDLREDVRFHDGSAMTAEDVVYTYRYLLNEKTKNPYQARFSLWLGGITQEGAHAVVFSLKQPYAMALYDLAMYSKIRKAGTYDDPSKADGINPDVNTLKLNGTGPYRVTAFRPGQDIVLERFDGYRSDSPKQPTIRHITIRVIPDWGTQAAEVMSGGVHWTFGMPSEIAEGAAQTGAMQLLSGPSMRVFYISLDATGQTSGSAPLKDLRVRRAVNHAIDRDGIVKNLLKGASRRLDTPCDPIQFGCSTESAIRYEYDPNKARALLTEAGYAQGFEIEFWAALNRPAVEAITAQLGAVGIRATLRYVQGATLTQARREQKIAMEFASSGSFGIPDAGAILVDRMGPNSPRNYSGDDALGRTIMAAVSTYDRQERLMHFADAVRRMTDQAYWVPLWTESQNFLMSPDLVYEQPGDGMPRLYMARWRR